MEQFTPPKKWKFALLIWIFIYPFITMLSIILLPILCDFHPAIKTLVMSLILVPIMAYLYIPL